MGSKKDYLNVLETKYHGDLGSKEGQTSPGLHHSPKGICIGYPKYLCMVSEKRRLRNKQRWLNKPATEQKEISKRTTMLARERSKNRKLKMIELKGGKCQHCGYNKCITALVFHHPDPSKKSCDFYGNHGVGKWRRTWKTIMEELGKCTLLCMNCHQEEHERLKRER